MDRLKLNKWLRNLSAGVDRYSNLKSILFTTGDIVKLVKKGEEKVK